MEAKFVGLDRQVDTYFDTPQGKLKLRQGTIENLITHYERVVENGVERTIVYRYDQHPTEEEMEELRAKHRQIAVVLKNREIYTLANIKIHLDTLPNQQRFIEIEAMDLTNAFTKDELKDQCLAMKSKLGIQDEDLVKTGYLAK
ncbi:CYTH domain-containing protein [Rufibacter sp. DG15C]|uniref:CYTH domain-containing protein n=1 Tax=Rufibacter sp. DG15C TaxID=1379909 RepID=UPI0018D3C044|nr:CYTH domain-containing protein [Rufibacter sp. DG15C]